MQPERGLPLDVTIDRGRPGDAAGIASVHVEVWRNAYAGILPDRTLAGFSVPRLAAFYGDVLRGGGASFVARDGAGTVLGFTTFSQARRRAPADAEIETLYVLDDWRDQGLGRALIGRAASVLRSGGARSLFLWVLADNPSRWFYTRLGARPGGHGLTRVGGAEIPQIAMIWDDILIVAEQA